MPREWGKYLADGIAMAELSSGAVSPVQFDLLQADADIRHYKNTRGETPCANGKGLIPALYDLSIPEVAELLNLFLANQLENEKLLALPRLLR